MFWVFVKIVPYKELVTWQLDYDVGAPWGARKAGITDLTQEFDLAWVVFWHEIWIEIRANQWDSLT